MFRPMTSDVSALSGVVAKGHQAMHFVSSTPSKIPYGGFSPLRLQTHFTPRPPSHVLLLLLIGRHWRLLIHGVGSVSGLASKRHREFPIRSVSPVALGSPSGSIVRLDRCLLWPHLRL